MVHGGPEVPPAKTASGADAISKAARGLPVRRKCLRKTRRSHTSSRTSMRRQVAPSAGCSHSRRRNRAADTRGRPSYRRPGSFPQDRESRPRRPSCIRNRAGQRLLPPPARRCCAPQIVRRHAPQRTVPRWSRHTARCCRPAHRPGSRLLLRP